jgi:hypothetical protein
VPSAEFEGTVFTTDIHSIVPGMTVDRHGGARRNRGRTGLGRSFSFSEQLVRPFCEERACLLEPRADDGLSPESIEVERDVTVLDPPFFRG